MHRGWQSSAVAETWKSLEFCSARRGELAGQLGARAYSQLAVDRGQRGLDRVHGDDQLRGHLLVGLTLGDPLGDAALGGREVVPCKGAPPGDSSQLLARVIRPDRRAEFLED